MSDFELISGSSDQSECYSTNQCQTLQHNCHWNAFCKDLPDEAFECICQPGFRGNGTYCEDACIDFCYNDGKCQKSDIGDVYCQCKESFTGKRCEVRFQPSQHKVAYIAGGVSGVVGVLIVIIILVWMICFRFRKGSTAGSDSAENLPSPAMTRGNEKSAVGLVGDPNFTFGRAFSDLSRTPTYYYDDEEDYGTKTMYISDGVDESE
ncbi:unnamed protein product [Soboliphyme baturini]|uniref:EGF-like domain-containing protein n=1 Tax=Soboliphyme baturini TaxID=241478 RepID=A0A183IM66_9BILA|nr:unnamed protein product [Soboliphyme baturini]